MTLTFPQKVYLFAQRKYLMVVPDPLPDWWTIEEWISWIDNHGIWLSRNNKRKE
jgi:hypothetical protein